MNALLRSSRKARLGLALLSLFALVAIAGPALVADPDEPVAVPLQPPSLQHPLGTTGQGQDVLAQTVTGARRSLSLGLGVGLLVVALGALVGITAGYRGGLTDDLLSLLINVFLILPGLPLLVVMAAYLPPGPLPITLALVATGWAWSARAFRAQARSLRSSDFVAAAVVAGESPLRVIAVEILPNMASLVASAFIGASIYALGAEAGLEFLGLGDLGRVSWGTALYWARNEAALVTGSWWTFVPAGACLGLVAFALVLVNDALDELGDPRLRVGAGFRGLGTAALASTPVRRAVQPGPIEVAPLVVENLSVEYLGERRAVEGVSFRIERGEAFGLVGPSGSGKSSIALALLRLLRPPAVITGGRVLCEGADVLDMDEPALRVLRARRLALCPQQAGSALSPFLTVAQHLADALRGGGDPPDRAAELLDLVGVGRAELDRYPHELSAGMRQRVVIAAALAHRPGLLILDEPTSALDVIVQRSILAEIAALKDRLGLSLLFIGHDLPLMSSVCSRIGVLEGGRLIETRPASSLTPAPVPERRPPVSSDAPVLTVSGLRKTFVTRRGLRLQRTEAVHDVSFELAPGEVLALVGESGCGKTTTARLIARLLAPTAGQVRLAGRDALAGPASRAYRARVQMVFQDPFASLNPVHTVFHHLARPLLVHGRARPGSPLREKVTELLAAVDLPAEMAARHPHQLSGGQRQRVAIARALATDPAVILADEPTSMLDASVRLEVLDLLRDLTVRRRAACLYITHDLASARILADRTAVMYAGTIVEMGPTEELIARPVHPYTRLLLAAEPAAAAAAPGTPARATSGCPFAPRCADVQARCREEAPPASPLAPGRLVRCHVYGTQP